MPLYIGVRGRTDLLLWDTAMIALIHTVGVHTVGVLKPWLIALLLRIRGLMGILSYRHEIGEAIRMISPILAQRISARMRLSVGGGQW
jgi:hypothetical protein